MRTPPTRRHQRSTTRTRTRARAPDKCTRERPGSRPRGEGSAGKRPGATRPAPVPSTPQG
eukprot:13043213-Alexandrium_andersonii.AAC.1